MEALKIDHLCKSYGKKLAVDHLSLQVEEGEFFGFIGPNGPGKSTTIWSILGLVTPQEGTIHVLGKDVRKDRSSALENIGFMPSESFFYPRSRVRDILKLSADLYHKDCSKRADELCQRLQLDPNARAGTLSLGNRKKLSILCALQHDPRLLILDEPSSGLDPLIQNEFFTILQELNEKGVTIFLSSHNLNEVSRYCSRAAILRDGRLVACEKLENLGGTRTRKVQFQGNAALDQLEGLRDLRMQDGVTSFLYDGPLSALLTVLSQGELDDLIMEEPDLEEIFLHYYQSEGEER